MIYSTFRVISSCINITGNYDAVFSNSLHFLVISYLLILISFIIYYGYRHYFNV
jgi:hypothetical protein